MPTPKRPIDPAALPSEGFEQIRIVAPREELAIDLTVHLRPFLRRALRPDGLVTLAVTDSPLVSLVLVDPEPGALADLLAWLERTAPKGEYYQVNLRPAGERTGAARLRGHLLPRVLTLPYRNRKLAAPEGTEVHAVRHDPRFTEAFTLSLALFG